MISPLARNVIATTMIAIMAQAMGANAFAMSIRKAIHNVLMRVEDQVLPRADTLPSTNLKGIFEPVQETVGAPVLCEVKGTVPPSCYGLFARNGPNVKQPVLHDYFIFDGDGMVHSVMMAEGNKCTYSCSFINTHRVQDEEAIGGAVHAKVGDLKYGPGSLIHLTATALRGAVGIIGECSALANTSLLFHKDSGSIIAMHEQGAPYAMSISKDGKLDTLGRTQFGGELTGSSTEPFTGKIFSFCPDIYHMVLFYLRVFSNLANLPVYLSYS
jgi:carotenoid cleavage dioxygenase-like enzyme